MRLPKPKPSYAPSSSLMVDFLNEDHPASPAASDRAPTPAGSAQPRQSLPSQHTPTSTSQPSPPGHTISPPSQSRHAASPVSPPSQSRRAASPVSPPSQSRRAASPTVPPVRKKKRSEMGAEE